MIWSTLTLLFSVPQEQGSAVIDGGFDSDMHLSSSLLLVTKRTLGTETRDNHICMVNGNFTKVLAIIAYLLLRYDSKLHFLFFQVTNPKEGRIQYKSTYYWLTTYILVVYWYWYDMASLRDDEGTWYRCGGDTACTVLINRRDRFLQHLQEHEQTKASHQQVFQTAYG
jgi:hypothetical protein